LIHQHWNTGDHLLETGPTVKVVRTRLGDESNPAKAVCLETFKKGLENPPADPPIPIVAADGQILNVGIADAVTDRPPHPYDFLFLQGNHKTMAARDQSGYELRAFVIVRLPPSLCAVEANNPPDLIFRGNPDHNRVYPVANIRHHFFSATAAPSLLLRSFLKQLP
jgi:hypothetical protein